MKLKVPFYKQTTPLNCGPTALKMVLEYLGEKFSIEELEKRTGIKEGKAISTLNLAIAVAELGFPLRLLSKYGEINEQLMNLDFYKKLAEENYVEESKKQLQILKQKGYTLEEKIIKLSELLSYVTENSIPVVILDWNVLFPRYGGYNGHFVPVVGCDEENVYIHNQGMAETQEFMPIKKQLFDKARKSEGTDEDILIIYRKTFNSSRAG